MIERRLPFVVTITLIILAAAFTADAQQPKKIPQIGYLAGSSLSTNPARTDAFRQGLRELGYVEGKSIVIEYRYADGKLDRLPDLVAELVQLKVDVIVTAEGTATLAAKKAGVTMPIVFGNVGDPVGTGIVSSLARPGGNITGLSMMAPDLDGKPSERGWGLSSRFNVQCPKRVETLNLER
jgi:putative ABC transport system substrate-binding protein